jgi:hypothetical protein
MRHLFRSYRFQLPPADCFNNAGDDARLREVNLLNARMRFRKDFALRELDNNQIGRDAAKRASVEPTEKKILSMRHLMRSLA